MLTLERTQMICAVAHGVKACSDCKHNPDRTAAPSLHSTMRYHLKSAVRSHCVMDDIQEESDG